MFDFNNADKQRSFDLIPAKTILPVCMTIRPGGIGDGGWLRPSQSSDAQMIDAEFVVLEGPFAKRKFWQLITVEGGKRDDNGNSKAGNMSRSLLRAMIESARGIRPDDMSEPALLGRRIQGWGDLNGLCFLIRIGIEKGKDGYEDKNKILEVITPDHKEYVKIDGSSAPAPSMSAPPQAQGSNPVPSWAR